MKKLIIATSAVLIGMPALGMAMTFSDADANHDGVVTSDEYVAAAKPIAELDFQTLDLDSSGALSADELRHNGAGDHFGEARFTADGGMTKERFVEWDLSRWRKYFSELDGNGDEKLSVDETAAIKSDAKATAADTDGDGVITFEEYSMVYPEPTHQAFTALDTNGDGKVSLGEIADIGPEAAYKKG